MKGKLIVIEGTDCSGKETQSNLLFEALKNRNINIIPKIIQYNRTQSHIK